MKALFLVLSLIAALTCSAPQAAKTRETSTPTLAEPQRREATGYVTDTGAKYHRPGCRHLRRSRHALSLSEAKRRGYEPCKVCRPAR